VSSPLFFEVYGLVNKVEFDMTDMRCSHESEYLTWMSRGQESQIWREWHEGVVKKVEFYLNRTL
jgi:hypothetical protein